MFILNVQLFSCVPFYDVFKIGWLWKYFEKCNFAGHTTQKLGMTNSLYTSLLNDHQKHQKKFAVLLDPDKIAPGHLEILTRKAIDASVDYFFVGGSLLVKDSMDDCLAPIKANCDIPVILFPGNAYQVNAKADGIFFLSLISGRNPELLIGQHVIAAPLLKESDIEVIPTGYMLINGGAPTAASYMSSTTPIPHDKNDIAVCTAMAGEMLGLKLIYMDAGSGARNPISESMIAAIREKIDLPIVVGGGICDAEKAYLNCKAGADVIVVGNAIEKEPDLITEIAEAIHSFETVS